MLLILSRNGYNIKIQVVDMREYGVPQRRKRVVVVGCRNKKIMDEFNFPLPSFSLDGKDGKRKYRTVREQISGFPPISAGESCKIVVNHVSMGHSDSVLERIKSIPKDGGSLRDAPKKYHYKCHQKEDVGFKDVFGRMEWDKPSPTITSGCYNPTKGRFLHPVQDRAISLREAASLQTFNDDFKFLGTRTEISRQIGNAFPPLYAKLLADSIKDAIEQGASEKYKKKFK